MLKRKIRTENPRIEHAGNQIIEGRQKMTMVRQNIPQWILYLFVAIPVLIRLFRYYQRRKAKQSEPPPK